MVTVSGTPFWAIASVDHSTVRPLGAQAVAGTGESVSSSQAASWKELANG
jgi:hypothetical protein